MAELIQYPDELERLNIGVVRGFDETVKLMADELVEKIKQHNLTGLSAVQIGYPWQIIAVRTDEGIRVLVNPRVIRHENLLESQEQTSYFPDYTFRLKRYGLVSLIYEDIKGESHTWIVEDPELAATIQRKIDYVFGSTPLDRLKPDLRQAALDAIAGGAEGEIVDPGEVCPIYSPKDYMRSFADKLIVLSGLSLLTPLFGWSASTLSKIALFSKIALPVVVLLMIAYYLYGQYEAKKYTQCTSCQTANLIGIAGKRLIAAVVLAIGVILVF